MMDVRTRERLCKSRLPFDCKKCSRRFSRICELQIHSKLHKKPLPPSGRRNFEDEQDIEDKQPSLKMVIRRNSSPIKSRESDEYQVVDLTVSDQEEPMITQCSPNQKDSGIDDCSPNSYEDGLDRNKNSRTKPVYSAWNNVQKCDGTTTVEKTNAFSLDNQSCGQILPDSTTSDNNEHYVAVDLTSVEPHLLQNNASNGFITLDVESLTRLVNSAKRVGCQANNIEVIVNDNGNSSRNIFEVLKQTSPSPEGNQPNIDLTKRTRDTRHDFDTGDSQFTFSDSNKVTPPAAGVPKYDAPDSPTDSLCNFEDTPPSPITQQKQSDQPLLNYFLHSDAKKTNSETVESDCQDQLLNVPVVDLNESSCDTIEYGSPCDKSVNTVSLAAHSLPIEDVPIVKTSFTPNLSMNRRSEGSVSMQYQSEFAKFLQNCAPACTTVNHVKIDTVASKPTATKTANIPNKSNSAKKVRISTWKSLSRDVAHIMPASATASASEDISKSFDMDTEDNLPSVVADLISSLSSDKEEETVACTPESKTFISGQNRQKTYMTKRRIKCYCSVNDRLLRLRRRIVRFLQYVFPTLEYPLYFRYEGVCVDALLDQIISLLKEDCGPVYQGIPLGSKCCDLRVLVCKAGPKPCVSSLRRKLCTLWEIMLPQLRLPATFNRNGADVDELLTQMIRIYSNR